MFLSTYVLTFDIRVSESLIVKCYHSLELNVSLYIRLTFDIRVSVTQLTCCLRCLDASLNQLCTRLHSVHAYSMPALGSCIIICIHPYASAYRSYLRKYFIVCLLYAKHYMCGDAVLCINQNIYVSFFYIYK